MGKSTSILLLLTGSYFTPGLVWHKHTVKKKSSSLAMALFCVKDGLNLVSWSHLQQNVQDLAIGEAEVFLSSVKWSEFTQWFLKPHCYPIITMLLSQTH